MKFLKKKLSDDWLEISNSEMVIYLKHFSNAVDFVSIITRKNTEECLTFVFISFNQIIKHLFVLFFLWDLKQYHKNVLGNDDIINQNYLYSPQSPSSDPEDSKTLKREVKLTYVYDIVYTLTAQTYQDNTGINVRLIARVIHNIPNLDY